MPAGMVAFVVHHNAVVAFGELRLGRGAMWICPPERLAWLPCTMMLLVCVLGVRLGAGCGAGEGEGAGVQCVRALPSPRLLLWTMLGWVNALCLSVWMVGRFSSLQALSANRLVSTRAMVLRVIGFSSQRGFQAALTG